MIYRDLSSKFKPGCSRNVSPNSAQNIRSRKNIDNIKMVNTVMRRLKIKCLIAAIAEARKVMGQKGKMVVKLKACYVKTDTKFEKYLNMILQKCAQKMAHNTDDSTISFSPKRTQAVPQKFLLRRLSNRVSRNNNILMLNSISGSNMINFNNSKLCLGVRLKKISIGESFPDIKKPRKKMIIMSPIVR
jgi:hypothetical protein